MPYNNNMEIYGWYPVVRLLVWCIGVPIIAFLLLQTGRRTRAILELDRRLKEEERRNGPQNPYAEMARMYETRELLDRARKGK